MLFFRLFVHQRTLKRARPYFQYIIRQHFLILKFSKINNKKCFLHKNNIGMISWD